jgi:hypothetical protein
MYMYEQQVVDLMGGFQDFEPQPLFSEKLKKIASYINNKV